MVLHLYDQTFFQDGSAFAEGESTASTARLEKHFTDLFAADGIQGKFVPIEHQGATFKSVVLLETIDKEDADYVIIQPSLKPDGSDISVCTRDIITKADCNIVCCHH